MEWYKRLRREASKPPAYMVERISDLKHASDVSKTSPSSAKSILSTISSQFSTHDDEDYATLITEASKVVLDNPPRAREMIARAIVAIEADKREHDLEKLPRWKR